MQLCLAAASGSAGNLLFRATRPTAGVSAWQKTRGIADDAPLDALFCQSATLCIAQDVATDMVVTTDPTGVAVAWTLSMVQTPNHVTGGISSPTAQLCASVGGKDVVVHPSLTSKPSGSNWYFAHAKRNYTTAGTYFVPCGSIRGSSALAFTKSS
jgi:hypothetical protein